MAAKKQSTVESSTPNLPGSSGFIVTAWPSPNRTGAEAYLESELYPKTRLESGFFQKQMFLQ